VPRAVRTSTFCETVVMTTTVLIDHSMTKRENMSSQGVHTANTLKHALLNILPCEHRKMAQRGCGGRAAATAEAPAAQKAVAIVAVRSCSPTQAHEPAHSGTGTSIADSRSRAGCERAVQLVEEERDDGCRRVACRAASALARHRAHVAASRRGAHTHCTVVGADTTFFDCFRAKYEVNRV
jgi:hypothetical protein